MIRFWIKGKKPVRIPQEKLNSLDLSIKNVRKYFPSDFSRLPRSIIEFEYWKATELFFYCIPTGPFLLKGILKKSQYYHFMLLHTSLRFLMIHETYLLYNEQATSFLYNLLMITRTIWFRLYIF